MAMARYVNRFCGGSCGILQEFENIANLSWLGKWKDNQLPFLLRLSSGSMIGYYYYEIASWLAWKARLIGSPTKSCGGTAAPPAAIAGTVS